MRRVDRGQEREALRRPFTFEKTRLRFTRVDLGKWRSSAKLLHVRSNHGLDVSALLSETPEKVYRVKYRVSGRARNYPENTRSQARA